MAVSPIIPNCVQVRLLFTNQGSLAINVLNCEVGSGIVVDQTLANSVGSAIKSAFGTHLGGHYNTSTGLVKVGVRNMRLANQAEFLDTGATAGGTVTGDCLPLSSSMAITHRTAQSGKSFRGRTYLPAMLEADNGGGGSALQAAATAAIAFIDAVRAALGTLGLFLAVASRASELITLVRTTFHSDGTQTAKLLSTTKQKQAQVTRVVASEVRTLGWESQRRRANGRGVPPALFGGVASVSYSAT